MKAVTESQVLASCLALLRLAGVYCFRVNNTGVFDPSRKRFRTFHGTPGVSDVIGVLGGGRIICVECKCPGGKATAAQRAFLDAITAAGGIALIISDVKQLEAALRLEGIM